jgi:F0F1-type ATP synthase membrane subunit b/b'
MIQTLSIITLASPANAEQNGEHVAQETHAANDNGESHEAVESHGEGAGEQHEAQVPWSTLGYHAFNLLLLISAIVFFGGKMMKSAVKNRALRIANHLETSNKMRKEAQDRYKALESRLLHMESEVISMKESAAEDAKREAVLIEAQTVADIVRIQAASASAVKNELAAARAELHADAVRLATKIAAEQLKADITDDSNEGLTREFITSATKEATANG